MSFAKKILFFFILIVVVFVGLVLVLAFNPNLQRQVILMALKKNADQSRLESCSIGWNEVELKGLYLLKDGLGLGIDSLDFKGAFSSFVFGDVIDIDEFKVKGLMVDMRGQVPQVGAAQAATGSVEAAPSVAQPAPAKTVPKTLSKPKDGLELLPKPLKIDDLEIQGQAFLADSRVVSFDLEGGEFAPGKTGELDFALAVDQGQTRDAELKTKIEVEQGEEKKNPSMKVSVATRGSANTHLDNVSVNLEELSFKSHVSFAFKDGQLILKKMDTEFADAKGQSLFALELEKEMAIPVSGDVESLLDMDGRLMSIELSKLPLALIDPFVPGYTLSGTLNPCTFIISGAGKGAFRLTTEGPFSIQQFSMSEGNAAMLDKVNLSCEPSAEYTFYQNASAKVDKLSLTDGTGRMLAKGSLSGSSDFSGSVDSRKAVAQVDLDAMLPSLLAQPMLASMNNMASGELKLKVNADVVPAAQTGKIQANIDLNQVQANNTQMMTSLKLDASADVMQGQALKGEFPLQIKGNAGESKLTLKVDKTAKTARSFGKWTVDLKGEFIYLDDCMALAQAFQGGTSPSTDSGQQTPSQTKVVAAPKKDAKPTESVVKVDRKAFWAGVDAEVQAWVDRVFQAGKVLAEDFNARFQVDDQRMMLEALTAKLLGAPLNMGGGLTFDEKNPVPYGMTAQFSLKQFNVGAFLTTWGMTKQSPVDGLFDVSGKANGKGENMDVLIHNVQGDFTLESNKGVFRPLLATDGAVQAGATVLGIAGVVNSIAGNKVGAVDTLNQLVAFLSEIEYNKLYIHADRGEDLNVDLDRLLVQGPQVLIAGQGSVKHQAGVPIPNQPLYAKAQLDAQGDAAKLLNEIGLLSGKQNDQGYYLGPSFEIKGTPANPDLSELYNVLQKAAIGVAKGGGSKSSGSSSGKKEDPVNDVVKGIRGLFK